MEACSYRNSVFNYVDETYQTKPAFLWNKYPNYAVLKHHSGKWYGLIMDVEREKLGLEGREKLDILVVKNQPEIIANYLDQDKRFLPAYHMNKTHWIAIPLDLTVGEAEICSLIDKSFDLT
ncbi:MmcQ/YjbR family DNA-binding protein [Fundicoccus culcitae]|uniref:MmcQ/YjbR family DNA-binding protein n=1 Tax=Fundicoccus culcitae TaxID=2969821 RepID=A0ABY5P7N8_9LACT|nr:MmcQ/YjbR family DNA-binding protein [Fundicoccus culcitae]UUX34749.1 MmcQ/YjbR family DNA-binding protein [Fundicoccus culcitae]